MRGDARKVSIDAFIFFYGNKSIAQVNFELKLLQRESITNTNGLKRDKSALKYISKGKHRKSEADPFLCTDFLVDVRQTLYFNLKMLCALRTISVIFSLSVSTAKKLVLGAG